jgi:hypothetical protein
MRKLCALRTYIVALHPVGAPDGPPRGIAKTKVVALRDATIRHNCRYAGRSNLNELRLNGGNDGGFRDLCVARRQSWLRLLAAVGRQDTSEPGSHSRRIWPSIVGHPSDCGPADLVKKPSPSERRDYGSRRYRLQPNLPLRTVIYCAATE